MDKWLEQTIKRLEKDTAETGVDHSSIVSALRASNKPSKVTVAKEKAAGITAN